MTTFRSLGKRALQIAIFGKGGKTGSVLLPSSVFRELVSLRWVPGRAPDGGSFTRYAGEDEPVFRSQKSRDGNGAHLEVSQVKSHSGQGGKGCRHRSQRISALAAARSRLARPLPGHRPGADSGHAQALFPSHHGQVPALPPYGFLRPTPGDLAHRLFVQCV